jgi:excinuclease UvrABC nuclease subunit
MNKYENIALQYIGKVKELLTSQNFSFRNKNSNVPDEAGVYAIFNERNEVIYIGRTRNLRRRLLGNHRSGNIRGSQFRRALMQNYGLKDEDEISNYIRQKCAFKFMEIKDPVERVKLEHFATAILAPTLNMKLKQ